MKNEEITPEQYDAEYDKLWEEVNGEEPASDDKDKDIETASSIEEEKDTDEEQNDEADVDTDNEEDNENNKPDEEDNKDEDKELEEEIKKFKLKAVGVDLELTEEEIIELAKKGIDYTKKTQWIAENKKRVEIVDGIPDEQLNALRDLKEGNKEALVKLAKEYNIDMYDLDADKEPEIKDYSTNIENDELKRIEQRILADKETLPKVEQVLSIVPDEFKEEMAKRPELLDGLYIDIKNGKADATIKEALKSYYVRGGSFLEHYANSYKQLFSKSEQPNEEASQARKKATIPKRKEVRQEKKDYLAEAEEIWNMPTDDFRKIKAKVLAKVGMTLD